MVSILTVIWIFPLRVWVINATRASQQNGKAALSGMLAAISSVIAYDYSWPKTLGMGCLQVSPVH